MSATLIVNSPLLARNSSVPSSGSTSRKRSATLGFFPAAIDSSAHIGGEGFRPARRSQMIASARRSADVTGLPSSFELTSQPRSYSSITAGPAASAALARNNAISSRARESSAKGPGSQRSELKVVSLILKAASRQRSESDRENRMGQLATPLLSPPRADIEPRTKSLDYGFAEPARPRGAALLARLP